MRDDFEIVGFFYETSGHKCRKYLDIKRKKSKQSSPDLMVVMMNPGSSSPLDKIDNNCMPSVAVPDNTQDQIMSVMDNCSFDYARIMNLSDLRTPDSKKLYQFLKSSVSNSFPHSIFNPERRTELDNLFIKGVPLIYGWGVNSILLDLAKLAVETISHPRPVGIRKVGTTYSYYHPLPRVHKDRVKWVENISSMLLTEKARTI
ncbi:MAG: hypothetical protein AB7S65_02845 [Sulfuricurvum sp.]